MTAAIDPRILSQLAAHDFKVEECRQTIAAHERRLDALKELEQEYAGDTAMAKAHLNELKLSIRQAESEVADLRHQTKTHLGRLNEITDSREYRALNEEIRYIERQIEEKEESTLKTMEEAEKAEKAVEESLEILDSKRQEIAAERQEITEDMEKQRGMLVQYEAARDAFYAEVPPAVCSFYDRRNKRQNMPVVWMAEGGSCSYCHGRLTPQARLEVTTAKKLVICESCGRVIVAAPVVPVVSMGGESTANS